VLFLIALHYSLSSEACTVAHCTEKWESL